MILPNSSRQLHCGFFHTCFRTSSPNFQRLSNREGSPSDSDSERSWKGTFRPQEAGHPGHHGQDLPSRNPIEALSNAAPSCDDLLHPSHFPIGCLSTPKIPLSMKCVYTKIRDDGRARKSQTLVCPATSGKFGCKPRRKRKLSPEAKIRHFCSGRVIPRPSLPS